MGDFQYTEATKVRVFKTPGWLIVRAPRSDAGFAEDIRRLPYFDRKWCQRIGSWAVRLTHQNEVIKSLKARFNLRSVKVN